MSKKALTYRERVIKEFGWDPVEPHPEAEIVGDPRANTVALLTGPARMVEQPDGTFRNDKNVATIEPYYCLPYPVYENGKEVGKAISHMHFTTRKVEAEA